MAIIKPFQGIRYNSGLIKDIASVVTPPYDVISPQDQEGYYQKHPNNIIRIDFGKELPGDNEQSNKYTRAAEFLRNWIKEGILKREDTPAIYIYDQEFTAKDKTFVRRGFISLVKLEPFDKGHIYPHEQTLSGPKVDRLKLMQSCHANISSIFALFPDENSAIDTYLSKATTAKPELDFVDNSGVKNKLWALKDKEAVSTLSTLMKEKPLFIADGHHRYETALVYQEQTRRANGWTGGDLPLDYVMMVCVSMNNPGLQILPTHRLVRNIKNYPLDTILTSLKESFRVECIGKGGNAGEFLSVLNKETKEPVFVMYAGKEDAYYKLQPNNAAIIESVFANNHPEWKHLDAGILHGMIIERILGINAAQGNDKNAVIYVKDEKEAVSQVKAGNYQLAFFMKPTLIGQVKEIAMKRKVMPPKSTYFYPKLITGIVINSLS
ncbi:MAG: DUF1015 domain-containing protein [Candidatus Brocadiaceae bacterium]